MSWKLSLFSSGTFSVAQVSLRRAALAERQKTERPSSPVLSLISLVSFPFFNTFSLFFLHFHINVDHF
jgi:hypothetical protein